MMVFEYIISLISGKNKGMLEAEIDSSRGFLTVFSQHLSEWGLSELYHVKKKKNTHSEHFGYSGRQSRSHKQLAAACRPGLGGANRKSCRAQEEEMFTVSQICWRPT